MRVIFLGSGTLALPTLRALAQSTHPIVQVITQPDRPGGRGRRLIPTPVKQRALDLSLPVSAEQDVNADAVVDRVRSFGASIGVVVAFGQKIAAPFRAAMPHGCINLHPSLLPNYRGAAPVQWAMINGEFVTGVSVFRLVDRMDAGPVLTARDAPIDSAETAVELQNRLADIGAHAVLDTLAMLDSGKNLPGVPQDDSAASKAPKFNKQDGWIRFDAPANVLARLINGLWSWPGANCRFESTGSGRAEIVTLARALAVDQPAKGSAGVVDEALTVGASAGAVKIIELKPQGGRCMSWADFVNGRRVKPGDRFSPMAES